MINALLKSVLFVSIVLIFAFLCSINTPAQNAEFKAYCAKYVIKCPINIAVYSNSLDRAVLESLLKDYLFTRLRKDPLCDDLKFKDIEVYFYKDFLNIDIHGAAGIMESYYPPEVHALLKGAFKPFVKINVDVNGPVRVDGYSYFTADGLKKKYITRGTINYNEIWADVITTIESVAAFEVSPESESKETSEWKINTHPAIYELKGFVHRYILDARLYPGDGGYFNIYIKIRLFRRRASTRSWTEIEIGDDVEGAEINNESSKSVLAKIVKTLHK